MRERVNLGVLGIALNPAETREGVLAVDVHRARAADALTARAAERERRVNLVLDFNKGIKDLCADKERVQSRYLGAAQS